MGGVEEGGARGCGQLVQDCTVDVVVVGGRVGPQEVVDRLMMTNEDRQRERAKHLLNIPFVTNSNHSKIYKCGWQVCLAGVLGTLLLSFTKVFYHRIVTLLILSDFE